MKAQGAGEFIVAIIAMIIIVVGLIFLLGGLSTMLSPLSQVQNQTINTLPSYITHTFADTFGGGLALVIGIGSIAIGGWLLKVAFG